MWRLVSRGLVDAALVRRHPTDGLIAASLLYDRANAGYFNLSANMQQLDLGEVSVVLAPDYPISAHLDLGAQFQSNGFTIDDLRRNLSGQLDVLMGPGRVGKWILDAALFEDEAFIGEPPGASGDLELNCFVGRVVLTNGLGKLTTFMLDTSTTVLTGFGGIALENGQFDVELMRRPKDPLNLDAVRDVRVTGSLSNLVISDTNAEVQRGLSGGIAGLVLGDEPSAGLPLISDQLTGETPCVGPSFDS